MSLVATIEVIAVAAGVLGCLLIYLRMHAPKAPRRWSR